MGWGAHKKLGPLRIFATVEASNLKFDTQIWFETSLPNKQRLGPKLAEGAGPGEHPKKIWDPLFISATVEASD